MNQDRIRDTFDIFPGFARPEPAGDGWQLLIRGRLSRCRPDGFGRRMLLKFYRRVFRIPPAEAASDIFAERIEGFLSRGEGRSPVRLHLPERSLLLRRNTRRNGHFQGVVRVTAADLGWDGQALDRARWIDVQATSLKSTQIADGRMCLMPRTGPSVISDIDDTIKATEVGRRWQLMQNTFLRPFREIPGMVDVYRSWEREGATFHYISSSPWQLYLPLTQFLTDAGFPMGSIHLRSIRLSDPSILQLVLGKKRSKKRALRSMIRWFPHRRFLLIGDSGEKDPELYGALARRFPRQVAGILIRELPFQQLDAERLERALAGVPRNKWQIYRDAEELCRFEPAGVAGWRVREPAGERQ